MRRWRKGESTLTAYALFPFTTLLLDSLLNQPITLKTKCKKMICFWNISRSTIRKEAPSLTRCTQHRLSPVTSQTDTWESTCIPISSSPWSTRRGRSMMGRGGVNLAEMVLSHCIYTCALCLSSSLVLAHTLTAPAHWGCLPLSPLASCPHPE